MLFKIFSIVALLAMVAGIWGLFFNDSLFSPSPLVIALQVAAAVLMIWARLTLGWRSFHAAANPTEGGLVTSGPYRFIRHPIYTAVLLFIWTSVLAHLSVANVLLGLLVTFGAAVRMISEERLLLEHYPEYAAYAERTRRVIPFIL